MRSMGTCYFGRQIKNKLLEKNMTQSELAKRIGVHEAYLSHIITGRKPGRKYRDKICKELGLDWVRIASKIAS